MSSKTRIGFDFDKVFVDYPPFIPNFLIDYLYKKKNHKLSYRMPGRLEQQIRILSHHSLLRRPIKRNLDALRKISLEKNIDLFLVSSRFSFLKKRTEHWTKKNNIRDFFEKLYFNYSDKQPHLFKDEIIKKEKIQKFVDDDLDLLFYLAQNNPKVEFYWLSKGERNLSKYPNIKKVVSLEEFRKFV